MFKNDHLALGIRMVRVEKSKTVNAPQEKIFALITDFEKLPSNFPNRYRSLKVLQRSGNMVTVEEDVTAAGREIHQVTKHLLEPESPARTKVSVDADLKLGKMGSMLGVFAKGKIKDGLERMIDEFENKVNSG